MASGRIRPGAVGGPAADQASVAFRPKRWRLSLAPECVRLCSLEGVPDDPSGAKPAAAGRLEEAAVRASLVRRKGEEHAEAVPDPGVGRFRRALSYLVDLILSW